MITAFCVTHSLRLKPYVTYILLSYTLTRTIQFKTLPSGNTWIPKDVGMILDQPYLATKLSAHWTLPYRELDPFQFPTNNCGFQRKNFMSQEKLLTIIQKRIGLIINLSTDWILVHLYPYCEKRSYVRAENLTADIQSFKWLTSASIRNQLPLFKE